MSNLDYERAAFVQRSHNYVVNASPAVQVRHIDARDVEVQTNTGEARATWLCSAIATSANAYKDGVTLVIDQTLDAAMFRNVSARFHVNYPKLNIDRECRVVSYNVDWVEGKTTLVLL